MGSASFYRVEKPFRIYRVVGRSATGDYHGGTEVFGPCYEAANAYVGDEITLLHGKLELARPQARAWRIDPHPPRDVFSTGAREPSEAWLQRKVRSGDVRQIPAPTIAVRARDLEVVDLPPHHPRLRSVEPSPELSAFMDELPDLSDLIYSLREDGALDRRGAPPTLVWRDHTEFPEVSVEVHFDEVERHPSGMSIGVAALALKWAFRRSADDPLSADLRVIKGTTVPGRSAPSDVSQRLDGHRMPLSAAKHLFLPLAEDLILQRRLDLGGAPRF